MSTSAHDPMTAARAAHSAPTTSTADVQPALARIADPATQRHALFATGFVVLFLELACIRWFAAHVVFLQFFTNIVLMAAFLGMSIGCLCAGSSTNWLRRTPVLLLASLTLAVVVNALYQYWSGIEIGVGDPSAPEVVFFGTEYRRADLARFVIPLEVLAGTFFVLIALVFIGPGQALGRCLDDYPNRVVAYTLNIGGSLAGILLFALASKLGLPPLVWFGVTFVAIFYLMSRSGCWRLREHALALCAAGAVVFVADAMMARDKEVTWSPYYMVKYEPAKGNIGVNMISHQTMLPVDAPGQAYSAIHRMWHDAGEQPFDHAMIIGAGSGNDVAHALAEGVGHVDAVEIDPVILDLGRRHHPSRPYDDARVDTHLGDGRNVLKRAAPGDYDLVVFALVDSLMLHSGHGSVRLESFLFTEQAFHDVRAALADDGVFVMYNFFRRGWIVQRNAQMLERVFGEAPLVFALPYAPTIGPEDDLSNQLTMIVAGHTAPLRERFAATGTYWFNTVDREQPDGFAIDPATTRDVRLAAGLADGATASADPWSPVAPATLTGHEQLVPATDEWPFLYQRAPMVPKLYIRGMLLIGGLGLAMLWWLAPGHRIALDGRMFFLGAAFMLLETRAVVHLALVFGSTWAVSSFVFFAILVMILIANLYVLKVPEVRLARHYLGLFICLAVYYAIPTETFLGGGVLWRYLMPCTLAMLPMFFAGVVFAVSFRGCAHPDRAFGANIAGSVVGGLCEYLAMLLGFGNLLIVAAGFYLLSAAFRRRVGAPIPA